MFQCHCCVLAVGCCVLLGVRCLLCAVCRFFFFVLCVLCFVNGACMCSKRGQRLLGVVCRLLLLVG